MSDDSVGYDKPAEASHADTVTAGSAADTLKSLLSARPLRSGLGVFPSVVLGELVAITESGSPLVCFPGQPGTAALYARTVLDLHGPHIGRTVVLAFEEGDATRPIVMGVLSGADSPGMRPDHAIVDADGDRLIVSARERLVLRCGKASITLTKEGKVLIDGTYVSSRASGAHRIKGGSVQIN